MKITRRNLAAVVFAPAAFADPQTQTSPQDELEAARQRIKDNAAAVAKLDVAMSTEPAFQFKA